MTPLTLGMQAFGPFADTATIDFAELGQHPLFLINGPTGAGKSSILDAICFALYGQTTGDERSASQMRCDQAPASLLTEVTLSFLLRGSRYRIRRVPQQERPKARGEGTTTQNAEAQLWRLDEQGEEAECLVARSVTDATQQVQTLLGLDASQFRQVMVLPQGKFRELLIAESKEREKIFSQLFQTHIYQRIEERLRGQANQIERAVSDHRQHISGILAGGELASEASLEEEVASLAPQVTTASQQLAEVQARRREAHKRRDEAEALLRQFAARDALAEEKVRHLEQQPAIARCQRQLEQHEQAGALSAPHRALNRAKQALTTAREEREQATQQVSAQRARTEQAEQALREARDQQAQLPGLRDTQRTLNDYLALGQQLADLVARYQTAQRAWQGEATALERDEQALEQTRQQGEAAGQALEQHQVELNQLASAAAELQQFTQRLEQRRQLETLYQQRRDLDRQHTQASERLEQCRQAAEAAKRHATEQEMLWHQGQAALLAATLSAGTPCPVCGSPDHPAPAVSERQVVSQAEVAKARAASETARQTLHEAEQACQQLAQQMRYHDDQCRQLGQALGEWADRPLSALDEECAQRREQVARRDAVNAEITRQTARRNELRSEWGRLDKRLKTLRPNVERAREEMLRLESQRDQLSASLPDDARDPHAIKTRLTALERQLDRLETAGERAQQEASEQQARQARSEEQQQAASRQVERCESDLGEAESAWQQALGESPFADAPAFLEALLEEDERQRLGERVEEYQRRLAELEGSLATYHQQLSGQTPPDVAALDAAALQVSEEEQRQLAVWQRLDARMAMLTGIRQKLAAAHASQAELEAQYRVWGTLSDVANGRTGQRISLQRFVLGVLLDDVLIQASERLVRMSRGRYQLVRREDPSKGNKASGLELDVADTYTGKNRPVATLSGGESFMAALSLALGLSDVVQAYAGGIQLDTLFIDEGFGSLDQDALDQAIDMLSELQMGGRMIGIISHVSELKEQMPVRIEVSASRYGSRVAVKGAETG